jgi:hypothetical protein
MSNNDNFGFGKFVPGFDFLQNLAKGASQALPQMPNLANWVAPTLNLEELEKRIGELKAVHFWLDQNSKALGATIQALEVQKMTLATLKGMNFNMGEVANALKLNPGDGMFGSAPRASEPATDDAKAAGDAAASAAPAKHSTSRKSGKAAQGASVVDPLQWWGALTQQFQQIAATALKDAAAQGPGDAGRNVAVGAANEPMKSGDGAKPARRARRSTSGKRAPRKEGGR